MWLREVLSPSPAYGHLSRKRLSFRWKTLAPGEEHALYDFFFDFFFLAWEGAVLVGLLHASIDPWPSAYNGFNRREL